MTKHLTPAESLQIYFDELLNGEDQPVSAMRPMAATTFAELAPVAYAEPEKARQQKLERLLQTAQPALIAAPVQPVMTEEIQEWEIVSPAADIIVEETLFLEEKQTGIEENQTEAAQQMAGLEWLENGRPVWAQASFDVLLFQVSGLTLAVPLISLGQIQPLTDELTPLFGQADWFMGLQPTPAGKIRTVNTARFVMPERYDERFVETAKYVISINGVPWGLAVDSVNQPIRLAPEDVKWRSERSKRPWLAGTVKAHMCALLDIPRIGQILLDADRNAQRRQVQR